ncbi:MAG: gliding motility-associated C-terminal domain-containing protein, partial [Odoribacter sp.]
SGVTYAWSPAPTPATTGSSAQYTASTASQLYSVVPTLNGCLGPKSDNINLTIKPELTQVGTPHIICKVDKYDAQVTLNGSGPITAYSDAGCTQKVLGAQWTGATVTFTGQSLGEHIYYFKGANTCGVLPVTINDNGTCKCGAKFALSGGGEYCSGSTPVDINILFTKNDPVFVSWSFELMGPDGVPALTISKESITTTWTFKPTKSGKYTLQKCLAFDQLGNSCGTIEGSDFVNVKINPQPDLLTFTTTKTEGCFGDPLLLEATVSNGTAPYEYIWTGQGVSGKASSVNMTIQAGDNAYSVHGKDAKGCVTAGSDVKHVLGHKVEVIASASPSTVVNGGKTSLSCTPTFTPSNGGPAKSYLWTPADKIEGVNTVQNPSTTALTANMVYTVEVTDQFGCKQQGSTNVMVTGSQLAVTNVTGGSECEGTLITLGCTPQGGAGVGHYTYLWNPSTGLVLSDPKIQSPTVAPTTRPGTYKATVTISDGVTSVTSGEVVVEVKEMPKLTNILAKPASGVNSVTSTLTVDVSTTAAALAWTPLDKIASGSKTNNATTQLLTQSETFTVQASLNGCIAEQQVTVTVTTKELTLTAKGSTGCAGSLLTVEALPVGGLAPYTYLWEGSNPSGVILSSPTAVKPTIQNSGSLTPGIYSIPLTVTDAKGQTATTNAVLTIYGKVEATATGVCLSDTTFDGHISVSNGTVPYTIYSDAEAKNPLLNVTWDVAQTTATVPKLVSGMPYTYYVKDVNGCNVKPVDILTDCSCGAQLVMTLGPKVCASSGGTIEITLQASGGISYSFNLVNEFGSTVLAVKEETATQWVYALKYAGRGIYRIDKFMAETATSTPGKCEGNVVPKMVDVQFIPTPKVDAGPDVSICGTEKVTLKANGDTGLTYTWDQGISDGVAFTPPMGVPTTYTVKGMDANGCFKEDMVIVAANPKPTVAAMASPNVVCKGQVVTLSSNGTADTYVWNNGGQDGANNVPQTTTKYTVTGTNTATGCSDTASVLVIVNLPAEITEKPKDRTIAIGKNVTYKVKAIGNNLTYEWLWYEKSSGTWTSFIDNTATSPKVSGSTTELLTLEEVPQAWDGRKVKCIVHGDCGAPMEAEAYLWVKECFDILVDLKMGEGIRPEDQPGSAVDGWYCKGTRISLKAFVSLADANYGVVANPHYIWTIDGLPADKVIESDSSVLTWVPEYYENDIVVKVCAYSDGACMEVCSQYLRLKARTPDDVKMKIVTSIDPERSFCPGDSIRFTVYTENAGVASNYHWYRDIFDKGIGISKVIGMNQKDTWVKVVLEPSKELCVERVLTDTVFLSVKEYVNPTLRIENNIGDTIACQGDDIVFHAIWEDTGDEPEIQWRKDVWDWGTGEYATATLADKDMWIKCILKPGKDVCFDGPALVDTMVIRRREGGVVSITADMVDKLPGDELTFVSKVENMGNDFKYEWYVNKNLTPWEEEDYISDQLHEGDMVECAVSGAVVCQSRVFSNQIMVDFVGSINRDTLVTIYRDERIKNLDMLKEGDQLGKIIFVIDVLPKYGLGTITPNGKFSYIPNTGFTGTDDVKYVIRDKKTNKVIAEGYIYITVEENGKFFIPNLITPNGDGLNDTWKLDFLSEYPNHLITIFDRNSRVVYESRNYQNDWDGTGLSKGGYVGHINLINGVYTYVISLGDQNKTVLKSWIEIRANMNRRDYR